MNWIRANRWVATGLGIAVVGLLLVLVAGATAPPASFGWIAYAPLTSNTVVLPGPTAGEIFGGSLAGAGLILCAGALGYLRGRRRT
ncbi:hypothetical protein GCM10027404_21140 [Arthrobacter tumbae]|uniref:hypothetical protein n=1 Tax=Arthrobacter tumbae TaxID=163874 RepID=UPI00195D7A3C|nr:hypothetical protein [Arthrobacter tumbae]MBM7781159.1 cytochrome c oxidase subunit 1 [Arthrobacter tumbae]